MSNGLRFNTGDLARFVVPYVPAAVPLVGTVVEIMSVGPFAPGESTRDGMFNGADVEMDYVIRNNQGCGLAKDWQLAPIDPPAEPDSIKRYEELEVEA